MSVAFRRENDEEHKEPRFELPIPPGPNLVTARGRALLEARVAELEAAVAAADDEARREAARRDLRYFRTRLTTAELAPAPDSESVAFGSRVTYRIGGQEKTVDLVGSDEAEPGEGRIGFMSPLGQALIGAEPGERIDFGGRPEAIEVTATGPIPAER